MSKRQPSTISVRTGIETDSTWGAVVPPIYLSTNYSFSGYDHKGPFDYSRSANPTRSLLAEALAELEGGAGAVITNTGMAAIHLVCSLLGPGDILVAPHDCYGGSYRLFEALSGKGAFETIFVDQNDEQALSDALSRSPKLVWLETPSNPLMRLVDIANIAKQVKEQNALLAVDNTFMSPVLQQPFEFGADIVVHSATKYINGHSDVVIGAVIAKTTELHEKLAWWANCQGQTGSAFDSYLTLRGLRTLVPRMRTHQENAQIVAEFLEGHSGIKKVYYPGLESHPQHELAKSQQKGFGAMLSFELDADEQGLINFIERLKFFCLAESLGGVESLIAHPATMTHAGMSAAAQLEAGITPQLLRVSVGLEDSDDLVSDLKQALDGVAS
ncbi:cystathionine gamma-synthase [Celerinatantimonas diazotrophica]|uniref:Cystathionine gamma-synthase n=1 Tax=Celerinatantimonas diazotrophica TaxID=412034 RepID=A0A4R1J8X5_9GAMM|nr:cystathionine gamma-synthase [Celerinatantimonas diazotrophica]TCK46824.1 cystathionine gamma-synthase [Celerinatantimonas diazotrophica]CAG9295527.1 Cystathionine gamma-synthase [Celerinatantimonas diazotrophica]